MVFKTGIMESSISITPKLINVTAYTSVAYKSYFLSKSSAEAFEVDRYN